MSSTIRFVLVEADLAPGEIEHVATTLHDALRRQNGQLPPADPVPALPKAPEVEVVPEPPVRRKTAKTRTTKRRAKGKVECPECHELFAEQGLGVHRARAHGAKKGAAKQREAIALTKCPSCGAYTSTSPCEKCYTVVPIGVRGNAGRK